MISANFNLQWRYFELPSGYHPCLVTPMPLLKQNSVTKRKNSCGFGAKLARPFSLLCRTTNGYIKFSSKTPSKVCLIPSDSVKRCILAVQNGKRNGKCFWACHRWSRKINSLWGKASSNIDCLNYLLLCQIQFSISKQTHHKTNIDSTISTVCI